MKKKQKEKTRYTPTSHGRASICQWSLEFYFITPEQRNGFLKEIYSNEISNLLNIETWYEDGDSVIPTKYHVKIKDHCWVNNLKWIVDVLQKYDYDMGYDE
jgi:hypothetical protein